MQHGNCNRERFYSSNLNDIIMFYKFENDEWLIGNEIHFPDGTVLSENNRISKDGWDWFDKEPEEYTNWKSTQEQS